MFRMYDPRDEKGPVESDAGYKGLLPSTTPGPSGENAKS